MSRIGDSASVQAVTRVNAEQALYGAFEVKHIFYTILHFFPSFQFLCSTWNPVSSPRPTRLEADAHRACQGRPSLSPGRTLRRFQAAPCMRPFKSSAISQHSSLSSSQFLCSTWNPVSSPRPTHVLRPTRTGACQGRPSLCPGRTLRCFQAAP